MLQRFITGSGQMWVLDCKPNEDTVVSDGPGLPGHRWFDGDPVPVRMLWDYQNAVVACENDPDRYRPDGITDAEREQFVAAIKARKSA